MHELHSRVKKGDAYRKTIINKCSDRSMEVKLKKLQQTDRPTNQPTDRGTDRRGHKVKRTAME